LGPRKRLKNSGRNEKLDDKGSETSFGMGAVPPRSKIRN
jgi:hypothetical protein